MNSQNKTHHFLAMWCNEGLECIYDVAAAKQEIENWEKETIFSILKEENYAGPKPNPIPLNQMILRARMNSQRSYEIYEFNSALDIDEVKELFKTDPQIIVNWIRENGYKVYSDYNSKQHNQVIR
jgi:hypothetical protein